MNIHFLDFKLSLIDNICHQASILWPWKIIDYERLTTSTPLVNILLELRSAYLHGNQIDIW